MNKWIWRAALVALCSLIAISAQGQIVFTNQFYGAAGEINPPNFKEPSAGTLFANNIWKVTQNNIDWVATAPYGWQASPDGGFSVDTDGYACPVGSSCEAPLGEIVTSGTVNLTAGKTYNLTFYLSGNPDYLCTLPPASNSSTDTSILNDQVVTAGISSDSAGASPLVSQTFSFATTAGLAGGSSASGYNSAANMMWQTVNYQFVAPSSATYYLFFQSSPGTGLAGGLMSWGAVVADPVISVATIPEPSTCVLLGAGLLALAALRRRLS